MTDKAKLKFILNAIATAGGPEQTPAMSDEVFLMVLTAWLLSPPASPRPKFEGYEIAWKTPEITGRNRS